MSDIINTIEKFNPMLSAVREYYEHKDKDRENYKNNNNSFFGGIIGLFITLLAIYLWVGIHNDRKESIIYKIFSFIISISCNMFYLLGNYIFNDNTTEIFKQFPNFPRVKKTNYDIYYEDKTI